MKKKIGSPFEGWHWQERDPRDCRRLGQQEPLLHQRVPPRDIHRGKVDVFGGEANSADYFDHC